jgi:hypothetical protein
MGHHVSALDVAYRSVDFPVHSLRDVILWGLEAPRRNFNLQNMAVKQIDVKD